MTTLQIAALLGALAGLAIVLAVWAALPAAPVDLAAVLQRWDRTQLAQPDFSASSTRSSRLVGRLARRMSANTGALLGVPIADLELIGRSIDWFVLRRLGYAAVGLATPSALWALAAIANMDVPITLPAIVGVGLAIGMSMLPARAVAQEAKQAREDFGRAVAAYLDLVAQERARGSSPIQALSEAATIADGWVFRRIQATLTHAFRAGITPWDALTHLAKQVGVTELTDLADIVAAAADGAAVYKTLTSKAAALRATALATDKARANERSEKLVLPVALLGVGFLLLVLYPAASLLAG